MMRTIPTVFRFAFISLGLVSSLYAQTAGTALRNYTAGAPATSAATVTSATTAAPAAVPPVATSPAAKAVVGFPVQIEVANTKLNLNGKGTRYKAVFKVYDMGMYTTTKVSTAEQAVSVPGPKRLQFVALREISTSDLGILFYRGIKENSSTELNLKHTASALRLSELASGRSKIMPGESFSMEFIPGKGVTFSIMDKAQGSPLGDAEFFGMVLRIWLGPVPADFMLKDALLGIAKG